MVVCRVDRDRAAEARGIVIVIDVIRAFTVASLALSQGARGLWLVRTVEEAHQLRRRAPGALLIGEVDGRLIPGFDLNNSPAHIANADVRGKLLIQRTGAGTQGAVSASNATHTLLCAFSNARATAAYAMQLAASGTETITLLPTHRAPAGTCDEDVLCADYLEALLMAPERAPGVLAAALAELQSSVRFDPWKLGDADFPFADIAAVLAADQFDFAISGRLEAWEGIQYLNAGRARGET